MNGKRCSGRLRLVINLILNLALGGWAGEIEDAKLPVEMEVDYVRVTKLSEE